MGTTTGGRTITSPLLAALPFFQDGKRREWMCRIVADRGGLKGGIWLTRIWIEAEDQKFGRDRAEIYHTANQHFRHILCRHLNLCAFDQSQRPGRREHAIDRFF